MKLIQFINSDSQRRRSSINKLTILINNTTHKLLININNYLHMTCLKF